jgi:hypothetical protein
MLLDYLKKGYSITPLEALRFFGSLRLGALIFDLRSEGYDITTTLVRNDRKQYASYKLMTKQEAN